MQKEIPLNRVGWEDFDFHTFMLGKEWKMDKKSRSAFFMLYKSPIIVRVEQKFFQLFFFFVVLSWFKGIFNPNFTCFVSAQQKYS